MGFLVSPTVDDIILITGIINLVAFLILLFSCRFIPGTSLTKSLTKKSWYNSVYKYHSYVWWVFVPSVVLHAIIAILQRLAGG